MGQKRPATEPRPSTSSRGQTGPVIYDSDEHPRGDDVPPSIDHGRRPRPVIRPASRFPPRFSGPLRQENWQATPRPGIQAGVSPRPRFLPPGPAPKRPGEARPQIEHLNRATGAPYTLWSPSVMDQIRPPWFPPRFGGPLRPENWQAAPRLGTQAGVPPRPGIQAGVSPRPGFLPPGPAPKRPGEARLQIEPLNPATGAPCTFWSPSARDQIRPDIWPALRFPPRFGGPLRQENWQAAPRPGIQAGVPPTPGIQAGVSPRPVSLSSGPAPRRPGEARPQIKALNPATGAPCTFWSPSARDQIRPWFKIVPVFLLGPPEHEGDHEQAAHTPVSAEEEALLQEGGLVAAERSEAIIAELGGDEHDHNALDGHNNVVNQDQLEIIEEGAAMDCSTAQVKNDETPAVEMMDDMNAIVAFEKGLDDFWDAVLHVDDQAGDDGNVEVRNIDGEAHAQPVLAQMGDVNIGDQGDANVELMIKDDRHELPSDNIANVVVDNGSGGILHGADRGDYQEAGDVIAAHDYAAVEVVKDDEVVVLREQSEPVGDQQDARDVHGGDGTIAEQPAVNVDDASAGDGLPMHSSDQGADIGDVVEVVNEEDEVHGEQPVLRQLMIGGISLECFIDNDGRIVHKHNAGDQAAINNGAGDYAAVEIVKDDEVVVLREQSEPVGDQQDARDVHGGDGTIAEQPAVNVDDASAGDGLPMHSSDQGADIGDVVEVVNEEDEVHGEQPVLRQLMIGGISLECFIDNDGRIVHKHNAGDQAAINKMQPELKSCDDEIIYNESEFPPLGQQPQRRRQADGPRSTSERNREDNDLIGVIAHGLKKWEDSKKKGNEEKGD